MVNIPAYFAMTFARNIMLALQQAGSRLRGTVTESTYKGNAAEVVSMMGPVEAQQVISRYSPMGRIDALLDSRWVFPSDWDLPQLLDSFDELRLIVDPKSSMVENARNAFGRRIDRIILAAATGAAKTGVNGATTTAFDSAQTIAVTFGSGATPSGFTVQKLKQVKKLLLGANIDLATDEIFAPITAAQHDNLLNEAQIINQDYNPTDKPVLRDGMIDRFLGINFIHTELVPMSGANRAVPVWVKSGMHLGIWGDVNASTSIRNDIQGEPFQAYAKMTMGSTRVDEKKVVQVLCAES